MYPEAVWGESLDTTFLTGGDQAAASWSRLPDPPSHLGFLRLFAAALDVHEFSGKILVGCTYTNDMCLYDVTQKSWEIMDPLISGGGGSIVAHRLWWEPPSIGLVISIYMSMILLQKNWSNYQLEILRYAGL